jgi:transposase, IS30 family
MTPDLIALVETQLAQKWSPEQISGCLFKTQGIRLSHERIYQHIWLDKRQGGELFKHLRRHGKKYHKRHYGKSSRGQIKNRSSIDERPWVVEARRRVGDWEIDTVIGKGHSGALVTLVERVTQFTLSAQVNQKSAEAVTQATIALL